MLVNPIIGTPAILHNLRVEPFSLSSYQEMVYCPVSNSSSQKPFVVHGTEGFEPRRADDECDYRKIVGVFLTEPLLYGFKLFKVLILNLFALKKLWRE